MTRGVHHLIAASNGREALDLLQGAAELPCLILLARLIGAIEQYC